MKTPTRQGGAIVVEMALVIIPLLILAFGVSEFGRAMYQYNALAKAVRNSARHLSQYAPGDSARIAEAKCLAVYGQLTCSGSKLVPGLEESMIVVHDRTSNTAYELQETGRGSINLVAVEVVGYQFNSVMPFVDATVTFGAIRATMEQTL